MYKGYNLSRYTIPEIYKNYRTYLSFFSFFYQCSKCFYINLVMLRSIINIKKKNIKAAFIDHGMYKNGLALNVLSKKNIPIYTIGYPKGLIFFINKKKKLLDYENIIQIKNKKNLNSLQINKAKVSIKKTLNKTQLIPWMRAIKFVKEKNKYHDITHLIYAHSFTDGQMLYGYDGFLNVYDWIEFTIEQLLENKNNKLLIKAHPGFFHTKFPTKQMIYDRKLFFKLIQKYENNSNIKFIKSPIKNFDLLSKMNRKTILISHHGSAILEGLFLKFKCIASQATLWSPKFSVTNSWNTKSTYKDFLRKNWENLQACKKKDLYIICYQLFCNPSSLYGKYFWQQIVADELRIPRHKIYEKSSKIFNNLRVEKKKIERMIKKISKNIEFVAT